jgi:hypothetical protein
MPDIRKNRDGQPIFISKANRIRSEIPAKNVVTDAK